MNCFVHDDLFLCATLIDARKGRGSNLTWRLLKTATSLFRENIQQKLDEFEADLLDHSMYDEFRTNDGVISSAGAQIASARTANLDDENLEDLVVAAAFGARNVNSIRTAGAEGISTIFSRTYNTGDDKLRDFYHVVKRRKMVGHWDKNHMDLFSNPALNIQLAKAFALDILAVLYGEEPSELVFKIASRFVKLDHASMSAQRVSRTKFIKNNCRSQIFHINSVLGTYQYNFFHVNHKYHDTYTAAVQILRTGSQP